MDKVEILDNRLKIAIKMLINCQIHLKESKTFPQEYKKEMEYIITEFSRPIPIFDGAKGSIVDKIITD